MKYSNKKVEKKLEMKKAKAQQQIKILKQKYKVAENKVKTYIKKNPEKAAMIAGVIGAAIGAALAAALKKKK